MAKKPTYEEMAQRITDLEQEVAGRQEVEESERKYRLLVDNANESIIIIQEGVIKFANPRLFRVMGYSPEEIAGNSFLNLIHPEDINLVRETHRRRMAGEEVPSAYSFRAIRKDGTELWVEVKATVTEWEGKPATLNFLRDITERKRLEEELKEHHDQLEELVKKGTGQIAQTNEMLEREIAERKRREEELRESEKRYKDLADLLPQIVYELDEKGNFTFANRGAFELSGYTAQDLDEGVNIFQALIPEDRERAKENIRRVLSGERMGGNEYTALRKDGTTFPIVSYASPIIRNNKPVGLRGIIIDLTELRKAEEALRDSEKKYRTLVENADEGIIVAQNGMLRFANYKIEEVTGYSQEELTSQPFVNFIYAEDQEKVARHHWQRLKGKQVPEMYDFRIITKTGETKWVENKGVLISWKGNPATLNLLSDVTDRKQAEEALRDSEERYRSLFENSRDAIVMTSRDGRYIDVNQAALDLFGCTREELLTTNAKDTYVNPDDREKFLKAVELEGYVKNYESRLKKKDGTEMTCLTTTTFRYDDDSNVIGVQGILRDVTEQKQAEKTLQKSEAKYRFLFKQSTNLLCFHDLEGNLLETNVALKKEYGLNEEDLVNVNLRDFIPDRYKEHFSDYLKRVKEHGKDEGMVRFYDKGGQERIFEYSNVLIRDDEGNPIGVRGFAVDVTDRKAAEEKLRKSEEKYRTLTHNIPGMVYRGRPDWSVEVVARSKEVCGYSIEELSSQEANWLEIIHPDDRERVLKEDVELHKQPMGAILEYRILDRDGIIRWVEDSKTSFFSEEGVFQGVDGIVFDITERKRMEADKRNLEAQLQQSQKMEAIGTLAGGIAHDFNNLLAVIKGQTSFMERDLGKDNPYRHNMVDIQEAINRGVSLTRQLLGFAEKGKYDVKPIDLNELILKSSQMFGRTRKELKISCHYEKDIWAVEADQGQIEQVLLNLYVNAAQAMPRGGELQLQTENVNLKKAYVRRYNERPGRYVKIVVSDTGEGMDEETQKKVFDPFFTTRGPGQGSGLGLASAYGIVKNHEGIMEVTSAKGKGTTFTIHLPASRKKVVKKKEEEADELTEGHGTILLVDDEELIIRAAQANLLSLGYEVLTAKSGEEALRIYEEKKGQIDLVILDMIMPKMGGGKTYDHLKEMDPDIRVLLASGYSIDGQARKILDRGCNGFIQKPFETGELSRRITEIIGRN